MSKKALNQKNLITLGPERLAALLIEVTKGNAAAQRRLRMELSAGQGHDEIAHDLRKRFAALRQAKGRIPRKTRGSLGKELHAMIALIDTQVTPEAPSEACDLLWALLHLSDGILARIDDRGEVLATAFDAAIAALGRACDLAKPASADLAAQVLEAQIDDLSGVFNGLLPALSPALGPQGLEALKDLAHIARTTSPPPQALERFRAHGARRARAMAEELRDRQTGKLLADIADLQGDVDGYIARFSADELTSFKNAPDVAMRLIGADRATEALAILEAARTRHKTRRQISGTPALDAAYSACLTALGRRDELRHFLWQDFETSLNPESLRRYLGMLPEFDDIEVEEDARALAARHHRIEAALHFFMTWPDLTAAARLVETRGREFDGDACELLAPAAEALEQVAPLASVLLRRAMITDTLEHGHTKRYRAAVEHLQACAQLDAQIIDYQSHLDHFDFSDQLRRQFSHKTAFWRKANAQ
ncbi:hypothetical protein ERN12_14865 [Rhodobacteraceae bacterium]|nr:hypothetical protein ERN12_14865 [Paracoccaceae bacterium]